MIVSAADLASESQSILDRVVQEGETVQIQRHGKTIAVIHPQTGVSRAELLELLEGRGFSAEDQAELQLAMNAASDAVGYAGRD